MRLLAAFVLACLGFAQNRPLSYRPIAASYSIQLDRVILLSSDPPVLHVYDPVSDTDNVISLSAAGLALSVGPDGQRAAVMHEGLVSYVNLSTMTVEKTFLAASQPGHGVVLAQDWIHIVPRQSIRISNGEVVTADAGTGLSGSGAVLRPGGDAIYVRQFNNRVARYTVSGGPMSGPPVSVGPAIREGLFKLWFNRSGDRLFTSNGVVLAAPSMEYYTSPGFQMTEGEISFDPNGQAAVVYGNNYIQVLDAVGTRVKAVYQQDLSGGFFPRSVFFNAAGNRMFVIQESSTASRVAILDLQNPVPCTPTRFSQTSPATVAAYGTFGTVGVEAADDCAFRVTSDVPWIDIWTTEGWGSRTVKYWVQPNYGSTTRTGNITAGTQTFQVTQPTYTYNNSGAVRPLGFAVEKAAYNKANDTYLLTAVDMAMLHVYSPSQRRLSQIPLAYDGKAISVSPNGNTAAVAHGGFVSYVDLRTNSVLQVIKVPLPEGTLTVSDSGHVYVYPLSGVGPFYDYDTVARSGAYVEGVSENYSGRIQASGASLLSGRTDFYRYAITPQGLQRNPNSFPGCGMVWNKEQSDDVLNGCGNLIRPPTDLTGVAQTLATSNILFLDADHSAARQMFALALAAGEIRLLRDTDLSEAARQPMPPLITETGETRAQLLRYVSFNRAGDQLYAVGIIGSESAIAEIPTVTCNYTVDPVTATIPYTGGSATIRVTAPGQCPWSPNMSASYITATGSTFGPGSGTFPISIAANPLGRVRRATVTVGQSAAVTITQEANPGTISLSPEVLDVPAGASTQTVTLTATTSTAGWQFLNSSFFDVVPSMGEGSRQVTVQIPPNSGGPRVGTMIVNGKSLTIRQAGANAGPSVTAASVTLIPATGGSAQLTVAASGTWSVASSGDWLRITSASGIGNGAITVAAGPNPTKDFRFTTLMIGNTSYQVLQPGQQGLLFYPLNPCRIADTRNAPGPFGQPVMAGQTDRTFPIRASSCGVPSNAVAYSLNVTVVPREPLSYLTIYPAGEARPTISLLNSLDSRIKANSTIVRAGADGGVNVFVTQRTEVILDINGYFAPPQTAGLSYYPVTPCRLLDTRNANGVGGGPSIGAGTTRTLQVAARCGIPSSAQGYALNVTAVPKQPLGYVTVWPTGQQRPTVSTLNALTGAITANGAITPAGTNGNIDLFADSLTDLLVDVAGYFDYGVDGVNSFALYTVDPCRLADTRTTAPPALVAGEPRLFGAPGACGIPYYSAAVSVNATVVPNGPFGYMTLWGPLTNQPVVSTLNALDGALTSNGAIVPVSGAAFLAFGSNNAHALFDVSGYFAILNQF